MSKPQKPGKRRGRPPVASPMSIQLNVRINEPTRRAIEGHRERLGIPGLSLSDAARDLLTKILQQEKLL